MKSNKINTIRLVAMMLSFILLFILETKFPTCKHSSISPFLWHCAHPMVESLMPMAKVWGKGRTYSKSSAFLILWQDRYDGGVDDVFLGVRICLEELPVFTALLYSLLGLCCSASPSPSYFYFFF